MAHLTPSWDAQEKLNAYFFNQLTQLTKNATSKDGLFAQFELKRQELAQQIQAIDEQLHTTLQQIQTLLASFDAINSYQATLTEHSQNIIAHSATILSHDNCLDIVVSRIDQLEDDMRDMTQTMAYLRSQDHARERRISTLEDKVTTLMEKILSCVPSAASTVLAINNRPPNVNVTFNIQNHSFTVSMTNSSVNMLLASSEQLFQNENIRQIVLESFPNAVGIHLEYYSLTTPLNSNTRECLLSEVPNFFINIYPRF